MSKIVERISLALMEHLRADEQDDFTLAARAALTELVDIFNNANNSSFNLVAEELEAELRESA